jgi:hypothetical protein
MAHLHVQIDDRLAEALQPHIGQWGLKKQIIEAVLWQLAKALNGPHGKYVLGAILTDELDLTDRFKPNGATRNTRPREDTP